MQLVCSGLGKGLLKAAITLGLAPLSALLPATSNAETAPSEGYIGFRVFNYQDSQPNLDRMHVRANAVSWLIPTSENWSIEGSWLQDTISGASPAYHSSIPSAKYINDMRTATELRMTHYLPEGTVSVGAAHSNESDYRSNAVSLLASQHSPSKNTTVNVGFGHVDDLINPTNRVVMDAAKQTNEVLLGLSQILTPVDIVQFNLSKSFGHGYFTDPYKLLDNRPNKRINTALLTRWNHHFEGMQASLRLSSRIYKDSFHIRSMTWTAEWAQEFGNDWTVTPMYRAYRQSAAYFYVPADPTAPDMINLPVGTIPGVSFLSLDQRLSAFKAQTWGLKIAKKLDRLWSVELRMERYQQRNTETPINAGFSQFAVIRKF